MVLYYPKDQGKSLGPMIPSKGLQGYGKWEEPNSLRDLKMLLLA